MSQIDYQFITIADKEELSLVCDWYLQEWQMPAAVVRERMANCSPDGIPFHLLLLANGEPVATGGIHTTVSIMKTCPRFEKYTYWLALVYTDPQHRNMGYGRMLCQKIEAIARERLAEDIYLFTHTAEPMYAKLDWKVLEEVQHKGNLVAVMHKSLR